MYNLPDKCMEHAQDCLFQVSISMCSVEKGNCVVELCVGKTDTKNVNFGMLISIH
jgi:hypothetical protein